MSFVIDEERLIQIDSRLLGSARQAILGRNPFLGNQITEELAEQAAGFLALAEVSPFVVPSEEVDAVWHAMIEDGSVTNLLHEAGYRSTVEEMENTMLSMVAAGLVVRSEYWSQPAYCGGGGGNPDPGK